MKITFEERKENDSDDSDNRVNKLNISIIRENDNPNGLTPSLIYYKKHKLYMCDDLKDILNLNQHWSMFASGFIIIDGMTADEIKALKKSFINKLTKITDEYNTLKEEYKKLRPKISRNTYNWHMIKEH